VLVLWITPSPKIGLDPSDAVTYVLAHIKAYLRSTNSQVLVIKVEADAQSGNSSYVFVKDSHGSWIHKYDENLVDALIKAGF